MERVGIISRIVLILMCLLLAVIVAGIGFNQWQRTHKRPPTLRHASHMAQAASIMDIVLRAKDPDETRTILRAVSGDVMRAGFESAPPPQGDLIPAPRVAAKVQSLMRMPAPGLVAYTDGVKLGLAYPDEDLEGVFRRGVLRLAPDRYLVVDVAVFVAPYTFTVLGLPSGFWIGLLGCVVAALTIVAALRELGTLRRLREAVTRFDGAVPNAITGDADGSELGRLIGAVGEMQTRVTTLIRERSFLIGAISHDAKTYLTRLRLRSEEIDDAVRRAALVRDIDAMAQLIETSLAYARGTTITPQRGPIDLADLIAAEIAEREALGSRLMLTCDLSASAVVEGDPVALKRVVANLLDNAMKFGRSQARVEVSVGEGVCRLGVGDDGPGVSESERKLVFSPYYRVEKSRSRQTGGTGLGLSIARQIVQAHGGTIEMDTSPLGGALLLVTLPLLSPTARDGAARPAAATGQPPSKVSA